MGGHQFCGIGTTGRFEERQKTVAAKNVATGKAMMVSKGRSGCGKHEMHEANRMASISSSNVNSGNRKQLSSFILFLSAIILVNLCPFHMDHEHYQLQHQDQNSPARLSGQELIMQTTTTTTGIDPHLSWSAQSLWAQLDTCGGFLKLMFTEPKLRLGSRTPSTRIILADARMLGKMAKVWYIKKKIKKLSKKLKKHTIAVPVFTAIPIYEHSYYPPHVTHVTHGAVHHAAAASSYAPAYAQLAATSVAQASGASGGQQQLSTSASNSQPVAAAAYHRPPPQHHSRPMYHHHHSMHPAAAANQIINAYAPSPPLFVDEAGGLYGHYGNAYGRYDGGYQMW